MPPSGAITGRLERAQANSVETLPLFIGAVLIAHVAGEDGSADVLGRSGSIFWARVVYVPLYAFGVTACAPWPASYRLVGLIDDPRRPVHLKSSI